MKRISIKGGFEPLDMAMVRVVGRGKYRALISTEETLRLYHALEQDFSDEVLVATCEGQCEVDLDLGGGLLRAFSKGRAWIQEHARSQAIVIEQPDNFRTLDRPPAMSQEQEAIQRLMMRNTREREGMMERLRALEEQNNAMRQQGKAVPEDVIDAGDDGGKPVSSKPRGKKKPVSQGGGEGAAEQDVSGDSEPQAKSSASD